MYRLSEGSTKKKKKVQISSDDTSQRRNGVKKKKKKEKKRIVDVKSKEMLLTIRTVMIIRFMALKYPWFVRVYVYC